MMDEMALAKEAELDRLRVEHERVVREKEDLVGAAAASGDDLLKRNEELQDRLGAATTEAVEMRVKAEEAEKKLTEMETKVKPFFLSFRASTRVH